MLEIAHGATFGGVELDTSSHAGSEDLMRLLTTAGVRRLIDRTEGVRGRVSHVSRLRRQKLSDTWPSRFRNCELKVRIKF